MRNILLVLIASFFFLPFASAHDSDVLKVKSKDYTCSDLQELVQEEGVVHVKAFGSLDVYANADNACAGRYCSGTTVCESYQSTWPTKTKRFCQIGYSCRTYEDSNR